MRFYLNLYLEIITRRNKREITDISNPSRMLSEEAGRQNSGGDRGGLCSRKTLRINLDDIGWTHILAPKEGKPYFVTPSLHVKILLP